MSTEKLIGSSVCGGVGLDSGWASVSRITGHQAGIFLGTPSNVSI